MNLREVRFLDVEGADKVAALLQRYKVKRLVTGHTVQPEGIRERFNGGIYLIDTGLLGGPYFPSRANSNN